MFNVFRRWCVLITASILLLPLVGRADVIATYQIFNGNFYDQSYLYGSPNFQYDVTYQYFYPTYDVSLYDASANSYVGYFQQNSFESQPIPNSSIVFSLDSGAFPNYDPSLYLLWSPSLAGDTTVGDVHQLSGQSCIGTYDYYTNAVTCGANQYLNTVFNDPYIQLVSVSGLVSQPPPGPSPVPAPASWLMMLTGLGFLAPLYRRHRKRQLS